MKKETIKMKSAYHTKRRGKMVQINISVPQEIANQFDEMCQGDSRSGILTQWIREKWAQKTIAENTARLAMMQGYSVLGTKKE